MALNCWTWLKDKKEKAKTKDYLKSAFYNMIMYLDMLPNKSEEYNILLWIHQLVSKKIKKLKDFISVTDYEND